METMKQISVLVQNEPGALASLCQSLAHARVNILALCVVESAEHGIVRLVLDDPKAGAKAITRSGRLHTEIDVFILRLANKPGVLADVATRLAEDELNVKYVYGAADADGAHSFVVLATDKMDKAAELLSDL